MQASRRDRYVEKHSLRFKLENGMKAITKSFEKSFNTWRAGLERRRTEKPDLGDFGNLKL